MGIFNNPYYVSIMLVLFVIVVSIAIVWKYNHDRRVALERVFPAASEKLLDDFERTEKESGNP